MDILKHHWLKLLVLILSIGIGWGALQVQVSANSKNVEKLEYWQIIEEKEGARITAQLEIVISQLSDIKQDIRRAHQ